MYKRTRFYRRRIEIVDGAEHCFITVSLPDGSKHELEVDTDVDGVLIELQREYWNLSSLIKRHEPSSDKLDTYYQARRQAACTDPAELLIKKMAQDKAREDIANALTQLSVVQSRRFLLKYGLEMTYREIALEEGCSVVAVQKSVRMAKAKLRSIMEARVRSTS
jgi:RNA polymerase sigma factor (sigma-70 family)